MKKIFILLLLLLYGYKNSWAQCPSTITISGVYTTAYTGSNSWIQTSGFTTIPSSANVTLDANPLNNGFVLLDTGFETQSNATFLAVVQTPCSLLSVNENNIVKEFTIFPNPVHDIINIKSESQILETNVYDLNGKLILNSNQNSDTAILDFSEIAHGFYFLKITTTEGSKTIKIIKD